VAKDVLVDVGIPTHDRPRFVVEAVESVLAQSFTHWRLVVSEDGPGNLEVAAALRPYLADTRVSHLVTGRPVGAAANMTRLLESGSARYVAILHDDDLWEPEFLERRVEFLEAHPECAFVFSGHLDIDGHGGRVGQSKLRLEPGVHSRVEFMPMILRRDLVATPTLMARRAAYASAGQAFDTRFPRLYDWEMSVRLGLEGAAGFLAVRDAAYRSHGAQSSAAPDGRAPEYLAVFEHADALVAERAPECRLPERERRRLSSGFRLSVALDSAASGRSRDAARSLAAALRVRPLSVLDRRVPATLLAMLLGPPGRRALAAARRRVYVRRATPEESPS
jgi:glycosyltransferase involved in cell wall biosynthesis